MPSRRGFFLVVVGLAVVLVAGCDKTRQDDTTHYSATKFMTCMDREHAGVAGAVSGKGYTATTMMWPNFAEWVYFYETAEAAAAARVRLEPERIAPRRRELVQLLRTQRANTLIFAPAQKDWLSPIKRCLERARDT